MTHYRFTDHVGDILEVRPTPDPAARPDTAVIDCDPRGSVPGVFVPAHRLAELVRAMYEAAGQPVPDLPVIADEKQVEALARLLVSAFDAPPDAPLRLYRDRARLLLAAGVTLPPEVAR